VAATIGPARWADRAADEMQAASVRLHELELRDLRERLTAVVLPAALLVGAGLIAAGLPTGGAALRFDQSAKLATLLVIAGTAHFASRLRDHLAIVLSLSFVGFSMALCFALSGAPDVALVVVLVETTLTLLFLGLISKLSPRRLRRALGAEEQRRGPAWAGLVAGAMGFLFSWSALSSPSPTSDGRRCIELAEAAHGRDVTTVILADFRGLDTAGELSVLALAVLGAASIGWGKDR
jgi:multicomponent Na+:H+ antiporter subunit A